MKLGIIDLIIVLDVPPGNSPINSEMLENTPIFNLSPKEQHCLDYDQELNAKPQEWDELIASKKSVMKIIIDQCNEDTPAKIVLDSSYEDKIKAGKLIKFLM